MKRVITLYLAAAVALASTSTAFAEVSPFSFFSLKSIAKDDNNYPNAYLMAKLANLAYKDKRVVIARVGSWNGDRTKLSVKSWFSEVATDTQGFVMLRQATKKKPRAAFVAIRGTQEVKDFLSDGKFLKRVAPIWNNAQIHTGFLAAANGIKANVKAALSKLAKDIPVYVTGHSLGGAVAHLIAWHLWAKGYNVKGLYTFGQPKVTSTRGLLANVPGRGNFGAGVNYFRFANYRDAVPRLPPKAGLGYEHLGRYRPLGKKLNTDDPVESHSMLLYKKLLHNKAIKTFPKLK